MLNRLMLLPLLAALLLIAPVRAEGPSSLRVVVLDSANAPVAGLALTLQMTGGDSHTLTTDAHGIASVGRLGGEACTIIEARQGGRVPVLIEGTMADGSLRLGLLPGQERTVLLRLDQNTLSVDGETLFAGLEVPPSAATAIAQAGAAAVERPANATATAEPTTPSMTPQPSGTAVRRQTPTSVRAATATATQVAAAVPTPPPSSRWPVALVMGLLLAIPCALLGLRALLRTRRAGGDL